MSGNDLSDMSLEKFRFWNVPALKQYLKKRNLSCVGTKDMVFAAWEQNIPEDKTTSEREKILSEDYRSLLQTKEEGMMPDPFSDLVKGWENEEKGYANEVGEAFRSLVHVSIVRFSYMVACTYVVADAVDKGKDASQKLCKDEDRLSRRSKISIAVLDTLIWQGLASVAIPGFTINRICAYSGLILKKSTKWPRPVRHWTTTFIGLACIPFIIKPIDRSVDYFMEASFRKWWHEEPPLDTVVHHNRND